MIDDTTDPRPLEGSDVPVAPSAFPRKVPRPCPTCGMAVPTSEIRCPRCRTLLITACSGACISCTQRTCGHVDDKA
jgi:hypothetical protein